MRLAFVLLAAALPAGAAPPDPKPADTKPGVGATDGAFYVPKRVRLTDEQQEQLRDLRRAYGTKLDVLEQEIAAALTREQRKLADEARQKALEAGLRGRQAREAVLDTLAASGVPAQARARFRRADTTRAELLHEIHQKKVALLTPEQREQLKGKTPKPKGGQ
jgi:Spy/CpxP family protein refolding chaperone